MEIHERWNQFAESICIWYPSSQASSHFLPAKFPHVPAGEQGRKSGESFYEDPGHLICYCLYCYLNVTPFSPLTQAPNLKRHHWSLSFYTSTLKIAFQLLSLHVESNPLWKWISPKQNNIYVTLMLEKVSDAGKDWRHKEMTAAEDEMVGWHPRFSGHELGQTPGDGEGQGSLACCSNHWKSQRDLRSHKENEMKS